MLSTNIDLDEDTCSLDLLKKASGLFGLGLSAAKEIIKEVAAAASKRQSTAKQVGAPKSEIDRLSSAFEHDDLKRALKI